MSSRQRALLSFFIALFLFSAKQRVVRPAPLSQLPPDAFSYSEPLRIATRHISLDLTIDVAAKVVRGTATLEIENPLHTPELVLDTQKLAIEGVAIDGVTTNEWSIGAEGTWGAPLRIGIPPDARSVSIRYATAPSPRALSWPQNDFLSVYSLNATNRARSWIPCQDTPAVRTTYDATLRVPPGQIALMTSGDNPRAPNAGGVYHFEMKQSVPAYLIAFAAGTLAYHPFDERTGVYAAPAQIADAAWELQHLPGMLAAAEGLLGPHPFPRHDVVIMPLSFAYGGMEHPMLNFITGGLFSQGVNHDAPPQPSVLIAHELAHSWAGDATTLATWEDVWLNEGFATYLALRIIEEMSGPERTQAIWSRDRTDYEATMRGVDPALTVLHRTNLAHPSAAFHVTSYKKGALFLKTLEDGFGRATFDAFLEDYFATFAFRWVDDRNFIALLRRHVGDAGLANARVREWIYIPGLPANVWSAATPVAALDGGRSGAAMESGNWRCRTPNP